MSFSISLISAITWTISFLNSFWILFAVFFWSVKVETWVNDFKPSFLIQALKGINSFLNITLAITHTCWYYLFSFLFSKICFELMYLWFLLWSMAYLELCYLILKYLGFPDSFLPLISNLISFWSENIFCDFNRLSTFWDLFCDLADGLLWWTMCASKIVFSAVVERTVLWCQLGQVGW